MSDDCIMRKKSLRREKRLLRESLSEAFRTSAGLAVTENLKSMTEFTSCRILAAYASDGTEIDLIPLLTECARNGKTILLPRFSGNHYEMARWDGVAPLCSGKWNIPEPAEDAPEAETELLKKALWLVPGVAFDERCARLGRGKGVYDSFLSEKEGLSIGIFYECQKAEEIPLEAHDKPLDAVVTEKRVYKRTF